jgi:hypothetical protein
LGSLPLFLRDFAQRLFLVCGEVEGMVAFDLALFVFGHHCHFFHLDEVFLLWFGQLFTHFKRLVFVVKANDCQFTHDVLLP